MRSAAARLRQETQERLDSLSLPKKMGTCPLCEKPIYINQKTAWRSVDGATARVHETHLEEQ